MKTKHLGVLLLCAIFWSMGIASFVYTTYKLEQVIPYHAKFGISEDRAGLSVNTQELDFGIAPRGATSKRYVLIENTQSGPRTYSFLVEGDIVPYIEISPQTFVLASRETKKVDLVAIAPQNADLGDFEGTISLLIEK